MPALVLAILATLALSAAPASAASTYSFDFKLGGSGSGNGQLGTPQGLTTNSEGKLYVADTNNHRVQVFNTKGEYLSQFGSKGSGNGQFQSPYGIATDSADNIYVTDTGNHRVQVFNTKGEYLSQFGSKGSGNGQFSAPKGITVDSDGNVYVGDSDNFRVQVFNTKGEYLSQFGEEGTGNGQFGALYAYGKQYAPALSIATASYDSLTIVFVTDTYNHRVQVFNTEGEYWGQFGSKGSGSGQFWLPMGIDTDSEGDVYVADVANGRVQSYSFGSESTYAQIPLKSSSGLVIGPEDTLWGITSGSYVEKWTPKPTNGPAFEAAEFPASFSVSGPHAVFSTSSSVFVCKGGGNPKGSGSFVNEARGEIALAFGGCSSGGSTFTSPGQASGTIVTSALKAEPVYLNKAQTQIGLLLTPPKSGVFAEWGGGIVKYVVTGSLIVTLPELGLNEPFGAFDLNTNGPQQVEEEGPVHGLQLTINKVSPSSLTIDNESTATLVGEEAMFSLVE